MKKLHFSFVLLLFVSASSVFAQSKYQVLSKIHLDGNGGWDYITMDESASRLYVSHGNMVQVVDVTNNTLIGTITNTQGVHGIAVAENLNKGFISDGRDSSVTIIDLKKLEFIEKIKVTGNNPDAILYDPFTSRVFTFNGRSSNSTVIDAVTNKVIGTIQLSGKPEFSATDGNGKIYVNIENKSTISEIDAKTLKVLHNWSIKPGEEPSGLAFDVKNHRLFSVCDNKTLVVLNTENGKVVATLPIGKGVDGVSFDPVLKRVYASCGEGFMTVVQEENENKFSVLENFPTQKGARTITLNSKTHKIYLPTAEYGEVPAPTAENSHPRPSLKPNSFTVLEVGLK
ncbi:MAG: YncE family protein [Paludibacter sp.]|nr:YncE family protein [Paludibacter sp.]